MAKATSDHDEIRQWVEARGGHPAHVKATGGGNDPGVLRIDFPGFSGEDTLEEISWEQFFEWFDRNHLAMLLGEEPDSRFNKIIGQKKPASRARAMRAPVRKRSTKTAAKKAPAKKAPAKKAPAKKAASRKSSARTSSAKKAASKKKSAPKKTSSKKAAAKKSSAKKSARRKAPSKKRPRRQWSAKRGGGVN